MSVEGTAPVVAQVAQEQSAPNVEAVNVAAEQAPVEAPRTSLDERLSSKFAALSRKEKEVRLKEQAIAQRDAEVAKRMQEIEERSKSSTDYKSSISERMKQNALATLREEFGLTYEQLTEMQLNDENPTVDMKMRRMQEELDSKYSSELEKLKAAQEEKEKSQLEKQRQEVQAHFKNQIAEVVKSSPEEFELVTEYAAIDDVYELMELVYENEQRVMDIKEAASLVEAELLERVKQEEARILKLKKLGRSQQAAKKEPLNEETAPTLSNDLSSQSPTNGERKLTMEEAKAAAAKLLQWNS